MGLQFMLQFLSTKFSRLKCDEKLMTLERVVQVAELKRYT